MIRRYPVARAILAAVLTLVLATCGSARSAATSSAPQPISPVAGHLVIAGGGMLGPEIMQRFIALAGGPDARIVVVPTAGEDSVYTDTWAGLMSLRTAGAKNLVVRHTRNRTVAESDSFAATIRQAGGVWFPGGRHWRLVDSYLDTRTEREFHALLARGGVIGGTSAGASIQASYLVRGAREGNTIMLAPGYERGFAFLRGVAIDQHVGARNRHLDLQPVVKRFPQLLGLGLDEGTAIFVHGTKAEVVGRGMLYVHNGRDRTPTDTPYVTLRAGEWYDLAQRRRGNGTASGR
ncbi:MAG TPA: cyanophycinase [Gemmatimonadaceae bacterium]|nr:cyanophycinase [Gemmatimonadaceae bacterium]